MSINIQHEQTTAANIADMIVKNRVRLMHIIYGDDIRPALGSWEQSFRRTESGNVVVFFRTTASSKEIRWTAA